MSKPKIFLSFPQKMSLAEWLKENDESLAATAPSQERAAEIASQALGFDVTKGHIIGFLSDLDLRYKGAKGYGSRTTKADVAKLSKAVVQVTHLIASLAKDLGADEQANKAFALLQEMNG